MTHDDDDAIFRSGKFRDDIANGEFSFYGLGRESIVFDLIALQMIENVALQFFVILAPYITGAERGHCARVFKRTLGIDVR